MFPFVIKLQNYKLILASIILFLYSCANIQPPSGGPKDEEPPFVSEFYPTDKTLNYSKDYVEIEFSEWVNRNQVVQNIMVSPVSEVSYKWSGRTLRIVFEKERKENTTYLISLGTQYSDNAGNKPDSSFSMTFSTGNKIDSGKIDGFVYGENTAGSFIYAYRLNDKNPDTLNPEITPAEYRTQLGNNGTFSLLGLPDGDYRIIVVKTQFRDNLFHPKSDEFGTYWEDVKVEQGAAKYVTMKLGKYPDYSEISLNSVSKIDSNKFLLEFSKLIQIQQNDTLSLDIKDSANVVNFGIEQIYLDSIYSKKMIIITNYNISDISTVKITIKPSFVIDTFKIGNNSIEGYFRLNNRNYGSPFEFNRLPFQDSAKNIENIQEIQFSLNKSYSIIDSTAIELTNSTNSRKLNTSIVTKGNALTIKFNEQLMPEEWYKLKINPSKILSIEGDQLGDSVVIINFRTIDWKQFPPVSGKLLDSVGCGKNIIALKSSQNPVNFQTSVKFSGNWLINEVTPGKYYIEIYCDENNNNQYDYGKAFPYKHAEKFLVTKQEVEVKPRWEVQNVLLFFKLP